MRSHLKGDWKKVRRFLNRVQRETIQEAEDHVTRWAARAYRMLIGHIKDQDLGWDPLSPHTVGKKHLEGAWVAHGDLVESFKIRKTGGSKWRPVYTIGPVGNHPSGAENQRIARWHEDGTSNEPARPLFGPTFEELKKKAPRRVQQMVEVYRGMLE